MAPRSGRTLTVYDPRCESCYAGIRASCNHEKERRRFFSILKNLADKTCESFMLDVFRRREADAEGDEIYSLHRRRLNVSLKTIVEPEE